MTGAPSHLVVEGLAATAEALGTDPELVATPVDHHERAVLVVAAPELVAVKVDTRADFAAAERRALREFQDVAPVPAVSFISDGDAGGSDAVHVTGLAWIAGDPIDQLRGDEAAITDRWRDAGQLLRQIHTHPVDPDAEWSVHMSNPSRRDEWVEAVVGGGADGLFTESATKELRRQLDDLRNDMDLAQSDSTGTCLLHGDCSPQHVLGSSARIRGFIDLGDAGIGDPVYDMATLTLWFPERVADVAGDLVTAPLFGERLRFHRLMRFAGGACWLRDHDFDPTPHLEGLYSELLEQN